MMMTRIFYLPILLCLVFSEGIFAEKPLQIEWGKPKVRVLQSGSQWTIQGKRLTVIFSSDTFAIQVKDKNVIWNLEESGKGDLIVERKGQKIPLRLGDAKNIDITPYETGFKSGLKIKLTDYSFQDTQLDLALTLFVCLQTPDEDLICELVTKEDVITVKECFWPAAFKQDSFDFTVVPFMQGMLLPKEWKKRVRLYDTISYGRGLYMPWWGYQQDGSAAMVILETPVDGGCRFSHPAGGPTRIGTRWVHSLGNFAYPRRARLSFLSRGNYVTLAKHYRKHVITNGHFVGLKEKIARSPIVKQLTGSPVIHTNILVHIQPESGYYNKEKPEKNHYYTRFDKRAEQLKELARKGIKQAYVHLDGWGFRGYDNLHPDILPPCPETGGWDGIKQLAQTCKELNYIFALHDQYRDYYLDAKSYDEHRTVLQENGHRYYGSTWYGGKQSILCSSLALGHVKKNYGLLQNHNVEVKGAYLDVFAVVPPDECYHPEHPVTRKQCLEYRGDCFDFIRTNVGVVSSEEPADWAIPHLDLVHHGPFALDPNPGRGPAMGIPVPLFSLVYHDAIFIPWSLGKGGWGIPENDSGYLHGIAHAGLPYLSITPSVEELERVRVMCKLNKRLALVEMTNHRFIDDNYRIQETSFADRTKIVIDLDKNTYSVVPKR